MIAPRFLLWQQWHKASVKNNQPTMFLPLAVSGANKTCFSQFQKQEVLTLVKKFWGLSKPEQDHLVGTSCVCSSAVHDSEFAKFSEKFDDTASAKLSLAFVGEGAVTSWSVCGLQVKGRNSEIDQIQISYSMFGVSSCSVFITLSLHAFQIPDARHKVCVSRC